MTYCRSHGVLLASLGAQVPAFSTIPNHYAHWKPGVCLAGVPSSQLWFVKALSRVSPSCREWQSLPDGKKGCSLSSSGPHSLRRGLMEWALDVERDSSGLKSPETIFLKFLNWVNLESHSSFRVSFLIYKMEIIIPPRITLWGLNEIICVTVPKGYQ